MLFLFVLVLGMAPIIAPANGIEALEGDHKPYPLSHKAQSLLLVVARLEFHSGFESSFHRCSQLDMLVPQVRGEAFVDFNDAALLGASFAFSSRKLGNLNWRMLLRCAQNSFFFQLPLG